MTRGIQPLGLRLAALLQALALLPMVLAGSVCLREGQAGAPETGICECLLSTAPSAAPTIAAPRPPECGPCLDLTVTAVVHSGTLTSGVHATDGFQSPIAETEAVRAVPFHHSSPRANHPPGWTLAILRC
jgi:hypothetical protein